MKDIFSKGAWKTGAKAVCFFLLLVLTLGWADRVLSLKNEDGLYDMVKFYDQRENSVDLLFLGTSHVFVNVHTGVLWDEYGYASYVLGGGMQPMWNTYYYLKEALKTQTPQLLVLDAFGVTFQEEYIDNGRAVSSVFGLRWSWDKVQAIRLSAPEERWSSFFLSCSQYHNRYPELTRADFLPNKGDDAQYACRKGFWPLTRVIPAPRPEGFQTEERRPMTEKTEEWYRKTIELAQSSGIPLLIVLSPYSGITAGQQAVFNTAADIAKEYGVPFVNFNLDYDALDLDFSADLADGDHLNIWGSQKYASALGGLIAERCSLPDHRGEADFQSWEDNARYLEAVARDYALSETAALSQAVPVLQDPDFTCAVAVSGAGGSVYAAQLEALGLPSGTQGVWLISGGAVLWTPAPGEETAYFALDCHDLKLTGSERGSEMVFDRESLEQAADGVTIFVYDRITQAQAAHLLFPSS